MKGKAVILEKPGRIRPFPGRVGSRWGGQLLAAGVVAAGAVLAGVVLVGSRPGRVEAAEAPGLQITYETRGSLPGKDPARDDPGARPAEAARVQRQRLTVDPSGLRLLWEELAEDGTPQRRVILRADRTVPVIHELLADGKSYREHSGDLNKLQQERNIQELALLDLIERSSKAEREEFFRENPHLRPDGKRLVKVTREAGPPFLGKPTEKILVTENERAIVEGLVARETPGERGYFQLFRKLGAFSDEVLKELAGVEGLLLKGKITVVTALRVDSFEVEAKSLAPVALPANFFEVDHLVRVDDVPKELKCPQCGKVFESRNGTRLVVGGATHLFCSEACAREARRKLLDKARDRKQ